ncbi:MAG TPA: hypothetical protein VHO67_22425 [Polyangia bacterium]|nr:hypothetical protein [Polyangia bacterium]
MTSGADDDKNLEPLPADVAALLARGRAHAAEPDAATRARLRTRLLGAAPAAVPSSTAGRPGSGAPMSVQAAAGGGTTLTAKPIALALVTYLMGAASGAVWQARLRSGPSPAPAPPRATAVSAPPAVMAPVAAPKPAVPLTCSCPAPMPRARTRESEAEPTLGRERTLLDRARAALVSGDADRALALLDRHRGRFPEGRMAEERDALHVQALAASGQVSRARTQATRFLRTYPASLFRPAVERAVAE